MKRVLTLLLALSLCLLAVLSLCSCSKELSEEEWRAAFAFENVRVDCTTTPYRGEPITSDPLYGGTHYLFDGELAAVANADVLVIGVDEPVFHEKLYEDRRQLILLFDFADRFDEFTLLEDGSYFCEESSLKNIMWDGDRLEDVTVSFEEGKLSKITYTYRVGSTGVPTKYAFAFSEHGQVVLEAPADN